MTDEQLKDLFRANVENELSESPTFEEIWPHAKSSENNRNLILLFAKAAAILVIVCSVYALVQEYEPNRNSTHTNGLVLTDELPTSSLMKTYAKSLEQSNMYNWTSPTQFLVENSKQNLKPNN